MTDTLFKEVHYSLGGLINDIGLLDIQRTFVWANAKVRDLFDSMYRVYPVGYFLFWQTGAEGVDTNVIGDTNKQKAPSLLIVDGQQQLTSLYAVIRREAVLRENFQREHIRIAFRPQNGTFAVPDATYERDPEYILDIPELLRASHIKPWAACDSDDERLDVFNGLLLASHVDALFDGGWVSFSNDGRILISNALPAAAAEQLGVTRDWTIRNLKPAHGRYLAFHRLHELRKAP